MGLVHARHLAALPEFAITAGCDLNRATLATFVETFPDAQGFDNYATMLATVRPDVVVIATNSATHAALTIEAANAGARGVYCEKPMAVNLADARRMVEVCRERGTALAVNHQRRMLPAFRAARRLIDQGVIGDLQLIRAGCAGDMLSDGTHLVDTVRHLVSDQPARWVFAQIERATPDANAPRSMGSDASGGWRYGHPIEDGAFSVIEFANGVRAELLTGSIQPRGRPYQDYEIIGSTGRLRREGDRSDPALAIWNAESGGWQPVFFDEASDTGQQHTMTTIFTQFARMVNENADHPLSGDSALNVQEIVMAAYESARLRQRVMLPLEQGQFPLELMI